MLKFSTAIVSVIGIMGGAVASAGPQTLYDKNGFEKPIPAFQVSVPNGWNIQGGVNWQMSNCQGTANAFQFQASSGDTTQQIEFYPREIWIWNSYADQMGPQAATGSGCPAAKIYDAQSYLRQVIQQQRPNARVISVRPRRDAIGPEARQMTAQASQAGIQLQFDAAEILVGYSSGGTEVRESFMTIIQVMKTSMPDMNGGMSDYSLSGTSFGVIAMRAPAGQLDFGVMENVRQSIKMVPQYEQRMAAYYREQNKPRRGGGVKPIDPTSIGRIYAETSDIVASGYNPNSGGSQESFVDSIHDQQGYTNTWGETVKLDSGYDRAFQTQSGDYVVTNDAFYGDDDPSVTELPEQQY